MTSYQLSPMFILRFAKQMDDAYLQPITTKNKFIALATYIDSLKNTDKEEAFDIFESEALPIIRHLINRKPDAVFDPPEPLSGIMNEEHHFDFPPITITYDIVDNDISFSEIYNAEGIVKHWMDALNPF